MMAPDRGSKAGKESDVPAPAPRSREPSPQTSRLSETLSSRRAQSPIYITDPKPAEAERWLSNVSNWISRFAKFGDAALSAFMSGLAAAGIGTGAYYFATGAEYLKASGCGLLAVGLGCLSYKLLAGAIRVVRGKE